VARRKISFDAPLPEQLDVRADGSVFAYEHVDPRGKSYTYSFKKLALPKIGTDLAREFGPIIAEELGGRTRAGVAEHHSAWSGFCRHLAVRRRGGELTTEGLDSITADDISGYDRPRPGNHKTMSIIINTLRRIDHRSPHLLNRDAKARIRYISNHKAKIDKPRDAFSPSVERQILEKVDSLVVVARDRISLGRKHADELRHKLNLTEAEVTYLKCIDGWRPLGPVHERASYHWLRRGFLLSKGGAAGTVCLRSDFDSFAFVYAIGLRVKMPIECLTSLRRDCLKNPTGGLVQIEYRKARAGTAADPLILAETVRSGGLSTPGGLIELVLKLTQPAADFLKAQGHPDANMLWVGVVPGFSCAYGRFPFRYKTCCSFVRSLNIMGDDGQLLRKAELVRMRKTVKSSGYRQQGGHLRRFADDNTVAVAARHYAAIPAHQDLHEQAIEEAAYRLRMMIYQQPLVVDPSDEFLARSIGITEGEQHVPPETVAGILEGKHDLWLASCADFWASPFGTNTDGSCASPFDDCIHCQNSVFTARKLPGLLSYLNWIEERRGILTEGDWTAAHGASHFRITQQILPKFAPDVVEAVRCKLGEHEPGFFLPIRQRMT
jgi:hypothetical protein